MCHDQFSQSQKSILNIEASLRTRFYVFYVVLLAHGCYLFGTNFSIFKQIGFVAHHNFLMTIVTAFLDVLQPVGNVLEWLWVGDIEYNH